MPVFSETLTRLRKEAGYPSAYKFYHNNGGRRHFPFTYVHYLRIEKGTKLPKPQWLGAFLSGLRLAPGEGGARRFFLAYLKDTLKTEEAYEMVLAPLLAKGDGGGHAVPGREAMRWMKTAHAIHLTPEQFRAIASDEATYWCSEVLANDRGSWTAEQVAAAMGLEVKAAKAGLRRLKESGLARETSGGRYRSKEEGKFYTFPGRVAGMGSVLQRVQGYWERMARKKGKALSERVELVRAEEGSVRTYIASLSEAVDAANTLATHEKGDATGLFLIEAKVRKLLPF